MEISTQQSIINHPPSIHAHKMHQTITLEARNSKALLRAIMISTFSPASSLTPTIPTHYLAARPQRLSSSLLGRGVSTQSYALAAALRFYSLLGRGVST